MYVRELEIWRNLIWRLQRQTAKFSGYTVRYRGIPRGGMKLMITYSPKSAVSSLFIPTYFT